MPRGLVLAVLSLASVVAIAADPESVAGPYVEAGDCWSYRGSGLHNRGPIDEYELCVTRVDAGKKLILAVATVKDDGREIDTVYSLHWGDSRAVTGQISTPPPEYLRFPLHVGDKYTVRYDFRGPVTQYAEGTQVYQVEVEGWEDVTVPAGKFRALKVVAYGTVNLPALGRTGRMTRTWWYVPQVNRHVKHAVDATGNRYSEELTAYKLVK